MIEKNLKTDILQKVEKYIKDIYPYWTVEFLDGSNEFLMHTHCTAAFLNPEKFHIILDDDFRVFEVLLFAVRIIDGELVFVYHIFLRL